jgi:hypothetical protein
MSKPGTGGWERLNCSFFAATCRRVLSDYLEAEGFVEKEVTPVGGVVYRRFEIFLEISYELQTCSNYSPTIVLGIGPRKYDEGGRPRGVPFWYVIPNNLPERSYTFWTFKTEADLESVLARIKDGLLEPHARPLWLNIDRLEKSITNFRAEY